MQPPRPRSQVQYQKPRRINVVSVTLAICFGIACWVGLSFWPVLILRSNVKNELFEALPTLWKLNLRPEAQARAELVKLKRNVLERLRKQGVKDEKLELSIDRSKKRIALRANFSAPARLLGFQKTFVLALAPSAETDASRVDW